MFFLTLSLTACGNDYAFAQGRDSIFTPDLAGCERRTPATMGALEVCLHEVPGVPSLTIR